MAMAKTHSVPAIRMILVDDSPQFLESATHFLALHPSVEVVGCALSGAEALGLVARSHPDLALVDWNMPGMKGLELVLRLKARPGAPRVVILTLHDTPPYRAAATAAGVDGFVAKSDLGTQLLPVIHTLFDLPQPSP